MRNGTLVGWGVRPLVCAVKRDDTNKVDAGPCVADGLNRDLVQVHFPSPVTRPTSPVNQLPRRASMKTTEPKLREEGRIILK